MSVRRKGRAPAPGNDVVKIDNAAYMIIDLASTGNNFKQAKIAQALPAMPSVLLVVFIVQLSLNIISTVGAQKVNDLAWFLYTRLPVPQAKQAGENRTLRNEVVRLQREMVGVSAQDNFAKWARLRRDHDKAKDKYEKAARDLQSFRSSFDGIVSKARWLGTQGVNFIVNTWYSKQAMFWLPQGWVPYYAEWVLSFPKAPLGSISVNIWAIACGSVISLLSEAIASLWALRITAAAAVDGKQGKQEMKMQVDAGTKSSAGTSKKEL